MTKTIYLCDACGREINEANKPFRGYGHSAVVSAIEIRLSKTIYVKTKLEIKQIDPDDPTDESPANICRDCLCGGIIDGIPDALEAVRPAVAVPPPADAPLPG